MKKHKQTNKTLSLTKRLRLRLGEGNGMEWKGIKKIILEYSSILLFGSFNGGNGKSIPSFESLNERE